MPNCDCLIQAPWIAPVEPPGQLLQNHALIIDQGNIVAVLPAADAAQRYDAKQQVDLPHHVLLPGLVNAHTHSPMTLLRGLADDLPLMTWLKEHIWPAEGRWVGETMVRDGTRLAVAEMLRSGTTCFNDMYFHPDVTAEVAGELGIRANIGLILVDIPSSWAKTTEEYLNRGMAVFERFRKHPLLHFAFAPHAPYSVGDEGLARLQALAAETGLRTHIHVHESRHEVEEAAAQDGRRPLARLERLGLVGSGLMAVHATQLLDAEIALLAERGSHIVHCPESNLKLASGFCPVTRLLEAGVNVALGTDGAASNNDLDMLGEMRTAALLAKGVSGDAAAVSAEQALTMATLNGARALGLEHRIGSLTPGKAADVIAVRLDELASQPMYHPISQVVYTATRQQVSDVWVAGVHLLRNGELLRCKRTQLLETAASWQAKIAVDA